jgi:tetratricopeptide (TPR) repeat protein
VALRTGDAAQAAVHYREALETMRGAFVDYDAAYCLAGLAAALAQQGRRDEAGVLWGAADQIDRSIDVGMRQTDRDEYQRRLGDVPEDAIETGRALGVDEATEYALTVVDPSSVGTIAFSASIARRTWSRSRASGSSFA